MLITVQPGNDQTAILQKAIDECFLAGGGEVQLLAGEHHTGGIRLRSRVTLHLLAGAKLIGSRNPADYFHWREDMLEPLPAEEVTDQEWEPSSSSPDSLDEPTPIRIPGSRWNNALIRLIHAKDAAVIGEEGSLIDGMDPYDELGEEFYRGPHGIDAFYCENLRFSGYTVQNTGNWAHSLAYCRNLVFEGLTAIAGHDGIHITNCQNVQIERCEFYTGDDCIAGFANQNVTVQKCEINTACSAFRFAGTNVYVSDCHIFGPARHVFRGSLTKEEKIAGAHPQKDGKHRFNMLSLFTYYGDYTFPIPLEPGNIVISHCRVENADRFLHYNYSGNERWQNNRPLASVRFEHIEATGVSMPLTAYGHEDLLFRLDIADSSIAFEPGVDVPVMHLSNCERVNLRNVDIVREGTAPLALYWGDKVNLTATDVRCPEGVEPCLTRADQPFRCSAI